MVRLGTIIGFYFFPILLAALGINRMMLCLTVVPLIGLVAILATSWEPVGRDVETEDPELRASLAGDAYPVAPGASGLS